MTPEQFCYWLQGYSEIREKGHPPSWNEWKVIQDHLGTVFKKVTPMRLFELPNDLTKPTC